MSVDVREPAYKVLADDLRAQITSGRLRPGDRLPTEPQLCQTSGVSRSTVREALRLLASQHLIVTTRGVAGGSFVVHPSPAQLSDILVTGVQLLQASSIVGAAELLEVRRMIDVPAAVLAATRRTDAHLDAMRATLFDPATADVEEMLRLHPLFHTALATATGNPLLDLISRPLHAVANVQQITADLGRDFWTRVDADHRAILDAIAAGRPEEAEAATVRHLDHLTEEFTDDDGA